MEILWNPGFLTVLGIIVTVIVAVIIYHLQRQKKNLSYRVLSNTSLLSVQEEIEKDIEILYKGKPIKQVQLIILKILCSGNIPIKHEDYSTPITINLGKTSQILSAQILDRKPDDLQVSISVVNNKVVLQECLLNQDDTITIRILATKIGQEIKVEGRIAGVKKIVQVTGESILGNILGLGGLLSLFISLVVGTILVFLEIDTPEFGNVFFVLMFVALGLMVSSILFERRNRNRFKKELKFLTSKSGTNHGKTTNG